MVRRFSHIVPVQLMRTCFEELVDTADQMLSGFEHGVRLGANFCASEVITFTHEWHACRYGCDTCSN